MFETGFFFLNQEIISNSVANQNKEFTGRRSHGLVQIYPAPERGGQQGKK